MKSCGERSGGDVVRRLLEMLWEMLWDALVGCFASGNEVAWGGFPPPARRPKELYNKTSSGVSITPDRPKVIVVVVVVVVV